MLTADFVRTIEATAHCLNAGQMEWMMFGGAAMILHGFDIPPAKDIDIIVSGGTAARLMDELSLVNYANPESQLFRSDYLLRPKFGPVPVEILGNFRIWIGQAWHPVRVAQVVEVKIESQRVFVPELNDLASIFDLSGRPKDVIRSAMIRSR